MDKHKIYITNFWYAANYGANLTAYALFKLFSKYNEQTYLIDNMQTAERILYNKMYVKNFAEKYLKISKYKNEKDAILITGSDQVFNPQCGPRYHLSNILDYSNISSLKTAFSASFGVDKEQFLNENSNQIIEHMKNSLSSFDFISVREKSGVEICKDILGVDAEWIIDPVFILDKSKYDDLIKNSTKDYSGKIVSYVLDTNKDYKKAYKFLSKKYGKKVIELVNSNNSVENWLSAIKNCDLFITDSFHGMCFAIIYNKPFICCSVNKFGRKARFDSICEMLNIENQYIENINDIYEKDCIVKYDYNTVAKRIEEEKQKGLKFLEKVLNAPIQITQAKQEVYLKYLEHRVAELKAQNNLRYQLREKYLLIHYSLPKSIQKIIDFILLKVNRGRNELK